MDELEEEAIMVVSWIGSQVIISRPKSFQPSGQM